MNKKNIFFRNIIILSGAVMLSAPVFARTGPVMTSCKSEIEKFCADKPHVARAARKCLETKKDELSEACKAALENTGPGKGKGRGMGMKPTSTPIPQNSEPTK